MSVFPFPTPVNLQSLQVADPVIKEVLPLWKLKQFPTREERQNLSPSASALVCQWTRLVEEEGVLYRRVFCLDGGEEFRQLVLPASLQSEVLTQSSGCYSHSL